jgi:hypothetical protein
MHARTRVAAPGLPVIAATLLVGGCAAITSAGPVGPMRSGTTTQLAAAWAYAYGPATATVSGHTVKGNAQMQAGGGDSTTLPSPGPVTVGFRQALGNVAEGSAELGQMDSGVRLRIMLPEGPTGPPCDLSFEARTGKISFAPIDSYQWSAAFEIYPDVTPHNSFPQKRLILSLGVAGGVFEHQLNYPFGYGTGVEDFMSGGPSMTVLRPEVRAQTAVGIYLEGGKNEGLSITVAPWFLLSHGTPTATCNGCAPLYGGATFSLTDYSQTWGASLTLTPSYSWFHGL